ncbi:MAG: pantoate--beta-alanine ligase [Candidatus Omnitrophota bacterium]|nr:pantoate--beta-alanine ligase [Candidatus Omnitrophota bacterium]
MRIIHSVKQMQNFSQRAHQAGKTIGFVPTMGALHAGHASLLRKCQQENDISVLSIFVNPAQFGPNEDFHKYPRPVKKDVLLAKKEKVDIILNPSVDQMYPGAEMPSLKNKAKKAFQPGLCPTGYLTSVHLGEITERLCGKSRPGHFDGVATVVAKLLNIVSPDTLYLGEKDAQQVVVLKRMIHDLNFSVNVKVCPTIRELNGLALSSRNQYLTDEQRRQSSVLYQALQMARKAIKAGERSAAKIERMMAAHIRRVKPTAIEYIHCVHPQTLSPMKALTGTILIVLAVKIGNARLIDNITVTLR